jgi:large subunit ribosomal protein L31
MKTGIHPTYNMAKVTCSCGVEFEVGSTSETVSVDVCDSCHPFYTGKTDFASTTGRAEIFKAKMEAAAKHKEAAAKKSENTAKSPVKEKELDVTKMTLSELSAAVKGDDENPIKKDRADNGKEVKIVKAANKEEASEEVSEESTEEESAA